MKIAVTGTHRVGKTTLIEELEKHLPGYEIREEAYYELVESGVDFSEIPTTGDYLMQFEHSIRQIAKSDDNVIFDRSPVDMLAYIQATDEFGNFDIQALYNKALNAMDEIDLLVYIHIEKPDLIGCPASALPELRFQVDEILNDLIWDLDIDVIEVSGSLENRIEQVMKKIG